MCNQYLLQWKNSGPIRLLMYNLQEKKGIMINKIRTQYILEFLKNIYTSKIAGLTKHIKSKNCTLGNKI